MLSRRALVGKLAAGAAVVSAASVGRVTAAVGSVAAPRRDDHLGAAAEMPEGITPLSETQPALAAGPVDALAMTSELAPWELLHPLAEGSVVAHGWRVAGLSSVTDGSCVLTLQNERGRTHRVHLCRNDGRPQGLVYTDRLDLVVMNGGQGDLPTDEGLAQAVAEVAHVLAANEDKRQQQSVVVALMPHSERLQLFADADSARLR